MELTELLAGFDEYVKERGTDPAVASLARNRLIEGHEKFGDAWVERGVEGNLHEALEELADLVNYEYFAHILRRRNADKN